MWEKCWWNGQCFFRIVCRKGSILPPELWRAKDSYLCELILKIICIYISPWTSWCVKAYVETCSWLHSPWTFAHSFAYGFFKLKCCNCKYKFCKHYLAECFPWAQKVNVVWRVLELFQIHLECILHPINPIESTKWKVPIFVTPTYVCMRTFHSEPSLNYLISGFPGLDPSFRVYAKITRTVYIYLQNF